MEAAAVSASLNRPPTQESSDVETEHQQLEEVPHQVRVQRRREQAAALAAEYARVLGYDPQHGDGLRCYQKAFDFYSANDHLLKRLAEVVAKAKEIFGEPD